MGGNLGGSTRCDFGEGGFGPAREEDRTLTPGNAARDRESLPRSLPFAAIKRQ